MTDTAVAQQLEEFKELMRRARELFGDNPIEPPVIGTRHSD